MTWKPIDTDRLLIRSLTLDEVDEVHRSIYSGGEAWGPRTREQVADDVQAAVLTSHTPWAKRAVVLKDSGMFLGVVRLTPFHNYFYRWIDEPNPRFNPVEVELSFAFGKSFWGQSYAFEASQAMIRYAFYELRLPRLVGGTGSDNARSANLHRRLGYRVFDALPPQGQTVGEGIVTVLENDSVAAILHNPLAPYAVRAYRDEDRAEASALGTPVIDWWHAKGPEASLHLVAVTAETGQIVGHLQRWTPASPSQVDGRGSASFRYRSRLSIGVRESEERSTSMPKRSPIAEPRACYILHTSRRKTHLRPHSSRSVVLRLSSGIIRPLSTSPPLIRRLLCPP